MNSYNQLIIEDNGITNDDIVYHKKQFESFGSCLILQHPHLKEIHKDADMFLKGDCYFCDDHNDKNLMCVSSRKGKDIYSVCSECHFKHNFINFNLGCFN